MPLIPGAQFGRYRIIAQVGQGGMGTVYKAFQPSLDRNVAIKVLPEFFASQPGFQQRFQNEAMAIAKLRHPNIPVVFDHGDENSQPYIVSEFLDGGSLEDLIQSAPMTPAAATALLRPIALALDYAHAHGVLHRDVKPSNILFSQDKVPFLCDFGLAKIMGGEGEKLTATGMVLGTPEYMAPEQCMGREMTGAADIYSLAIVAFQMLTARLPFEAPTPAAVIIAQIQSPLPLPSTLNPEIGPSVEAAILKALAKDPAGRYGSAGEFVEALAAGQSSPESGAQPPRVRDARDDDRPLLWVTYREDPVGGWSSLRNSSVLHFDFIAACSERHPHVMWSPLSSDLQMCINWAVHMSGSSSGTSGTFISILAAVTWAAGCEGRSPREAMYWLSAGQLKSVRDYCLDRARALGKGDIPLWTGLDAALASQDLSMAVSTTWQILAPFEEVMRKSSEVGFDTRPLDFSAWLEAGSKLVLTLPVNPTRIQRSIPNALYNLAQYSDRGQPHPRLMSGPGAHQFIWQRPGGNGEEKLVHWRGTDALPEN